MPDVFVGREAELNQLDAEWTLAASGSPRVIRLIGEAGVGKTALLRRWAAQLPADALVLEARARADEAERQSEYSLLGQILPQEPAPDTSPLVAGAALLRQLGLAALAPLLLVVDDAQWADAASLYALAFGLRRLRVARVMAVFASREDSGSESSGLARISEDRGVTIPLIGLCPGEVAALSLATGRGELSLRCAERLRDHTSGNPLHLRALLAELDRQDLLDLQRDLPAPRSYARLVVGLLARLPTEAQDLAVAAAVLGDRCLLSHAAHLAHLSDPTRALDELQDTGLIRATTIPTGWLLRWSHPLVRAAIYDDLGLHERGSLHRAAAAMLSGVPSLEHLMVAGVGPDESLSARLEAAATDLVASGRPTRAAGLLMGACRRSGTEDAAHRRLIDALDLLLTAGDVAAAQPLAAALPTAPDSSRAAATLARLAFLSGEPSRARTLAQEAWHGCPEDDLMRPYSAVTLAQLCLLAGELDDACAWAGRASARDGLPPHHRSAVEAVAATALVLSGRACEARERVKHLPEDPAKVSHEQHEQLRARGHVRLVTDEVSSARADFLTVGLSRHNDLAPGRLTALAAAAEAEYRLGEWGPALSHAEQAISLVEDTGQGWLAALARCMPVLVLAPTGCWDQAEQHIERAHEAADIIGDAASAAYVLDARAHLAACRGDHQAVVDLCLPLMHGRAAVLREPGVLRWPAHLLSALISLGRLDEADLALAPLLSRATELDRRSRLAELARVQGQLASRRGDLDTARHAFESALALGSAADALERAQASMAYGSFLRRRGERRHATKLLLTAREQLERLGARVFLATGDAELTLLGIRPNIHCSAPPLDPLTPQERLVAQLVCSGLTNREVADQLVLSVKTVGHHLGNAYTKLGVHSRTQLARHPSMRPTSVVPARGTDP